MTTLRISDRALLSLDLSAIAAPIDRWSVTNPKQFDLDLTLDIDYHRDPQDPRELSEIAEVRLWFIRLDACYPYRQICGDASTSSIQSQRWDSVQS
jgi:hypothetical protein